jgi:hypothetical protein
MAKVMQKQRRRRECESQIDEGWRRERWPKTAVLVAGAPGNFHHYHHHHTTSKRSQPHAGGARARTRNRYSTDMSILYLYLGDEDRQSTIVTHLSLTTLSLDLGGDNSSNCHSEAVLGLSLPVLVVDLRAQVQHCIKIVPGQVGIQIHATTAPDW